MPQAPFSDSTPPAARTGAVSRVLIVTLALNLAAAGVKLAAAGASGSLALMAGGIDSAFDGAANVFGLVAIRVAARPPDARHPYGYRKFETLVAVVIAVLLFVTCGQLAWSALQGIPRILAGEGEPRVGAWSLLAPAAAFGLNLAASIYERRRGRELGSELLVADAGHTRADAAVSMALFLGLLAVRAGYPLLDPLLALAIAGVVARTGLEIVRDTSEVLADAAVFDPDEITEVARAVPGVAGAHQPRSRGPADAVAIDLHVQVDPTLGIGRAHAIGHAVKSRLREHFPGTSDVVVHVEPEWAMIDGGDTAARVRRALDRFPVEAHDLHVQRNTADGRVEVSVHLELDPGLSLAAAHALADEIEAEVLRHAPAVDRIVTHLEPRAGAPEAVEGMPAARDYVDLIRRCAAGISGLSNVHDVAVVRCAAGVRLSAHVDAAATALLAEVHALAEDLETRVRAAAPELERVTIHVEPKGDGG